MELSINQVGKIYRGGIEALTRIDLGLQPGVHGLLGPNGAGKSTLMRILATITRPTSGSVTWEGTDIVRHPNRVREVLGYLPQDFGVYPQLTAEEFLNYLAAAKGLSRRRARTRIDELLTAVNLNAVRRQLLATFSGGMKQRVGIAQALLNDPQLLIVDEPTAGLDPEERVRFRNLLSELSGERIVILSTHIVSDVEAIATRIAVLHHGHLISDRLPEALLREATGKVWEVLIASDRLSEFRRRWIITGSVRRSDGVHVRVVAAESPVPDARSVPPTLEDAYLYLIATDREAQAA
jgi:ABC-type multidrug transport system ATPase subunit